jgi:hypothetical protein|tara:strand:+ start:969 stop:2027 length:1059 start_codon:yes stop_codon:yes gene_type:complete
MASPSKAWSTTVDGDEHALWFMNKGGGNGGAFSLSSDFQAFVKWEDHPLKYLFATVCLVSMLTWIGFAGDNLQFHRSYASLSFAGGCTAKQLWKNSWNESGVVLLVFRLSAFAASAWFTVTQIIKPNIAAGGTVGNFMNFHDWSFYLLTVFFLVGSLVSIKGVCGGGTARGYDKFLGHNGDMNTLGHWLLTLYSAAFTTALVCDVLVWCELLFAPQCVSEHFRGKLSTLLDPTSRLCYFEWSFLAGFMGNLLLLLMESTLGQLTFPKCYLSTPLFVFGLFTVMNYVQHEVFFKDWAYDQLNFFRWTTILYMNGFFGLLFGGHFFLNWFLSMGEGDKKPATMGGEHMPLFSQQ